MRGSTSQDNAQETSTPVPIQSNRRRKSGQRRSSHGPSPQASPSSSAPTSSTPTFSPATPTFTNKQQQPQQKNKFKEHMDRSSLQNGLKTGQIWRGRFRVNSHDKSEAYVTIDGIPVDVFIQGLAQNRALEGDEVAVVLHPLNDWRTMKRTNSGKQATGEPTRSWQQPGSSGMTPASPSASSHPSSQSPHSATPQSPKPAAAVAPSAFLGMIQQRFKNIELGTPTPTSTSTPTSSSPFNPFAPTTPPTNPTPTPTPDTPWSSATTPATSLEAITQTLAANPTSRPTGYVVAILQPSERRETVIGVLVSPMGSTIYVNPVDPRLPRMVVNPEGLSEELREEALNREVTNRTLVSARVLEWGVDYSHPWVAVRQSIGQAGEIASETSALLMAEQVRTDEFSEEVLACLPDLPWSITEEDLAERRDLRSTRIFSIDPPTARDLDDALSIEELGGGRYRVGVHIADVAHFVRAGTPLDTEAALRSTSTYLVDRVIPMLPRPLCENLCSLNAGVDRLAFSMVFDMTEGGEVKDVWAGRSVICSCAKLAYIHAQKMIDGVFYPEEEGVQLVGGFTWEQVQADVWSLHRIAASLRAARFSAGALKLHNLKLTFKMGPDGNPIEAEPYGAMDSHWLVEEMMLLANRTAARITSDAFPKLAVLRRHPPPDQKKLGEVAVMAAALGIDLQTTSAGALQASLETLRSSCQDATMAAMVQNLATKAMQLAKYFCTGTLEDQAAWRHYALAMDHYTHFTSPIRRYPDILVHRLLAAALELPRVPSHPPSPLPAFARDPATLAAAAHSHGLRPAEDAHAIAEHANKRKLAARNVQDGSIRLFLAVLLKRKPVVTQGVLLSPGGDRFVQVFLPEYGCEQRIQFDQCTSPVLPQFDKESGTLSLFSASPEALLGLPTPLNPRSYPRQLQPDFDEASWQASLQNLQNPHNLAPLTLPCELTAFSKVSLILGAHISTNLPGHPVDISARLYVGARLAGDTGGAAAVGEADTTRSFSINWADSTLD